MKLSLSTCLILILFLSALKANSNEKVNIIYINVDDLGVMDVGFMGDQRYKTPNLDRFAKQGMVFKKAYAPAANCAPSRASCLTGQYTPRHGVYTVGSSSRGKSSLRKLIPTKNQKFVGENSILVSDVLKNNGYRTCTIGKWHISRIPENKGFEINIGGLDKGHPKSYFSPYHNPKLSDGPDGEYLTDRLTREAINFIDQHGNQPFFLYLPYYTVHTPLQGKPELMNKYSNRNDVDHHYAAMIECFDDNFGKLMNRIDSLPSRDNTLIIFTSDNGGIKTISSQAPFRSGKGAYYEGGIRVPLAIRWPRVIKEKSFCDVAVSGIDFYPTILEAARISKPKDLTLDGLSLIPLFSFHSIKDRALFWHFPIYLQAYKIGCDGSRDDFFRTRPGSAMVWKNWKLHHYFEDDTYELYDLNLDSNESNDLSKSMPEELDVLINKMNKWRASVDAPIPNQINPRYQAN